MNGAFLQSANLWAELETFGTVSIGAAAGCVERGSYCDSDQLAFAMLLGYNSKGDCDKVMNLIETCE